MIEAVTFDLWDTVIRDDSDEPKRAAGGLPPKREARRQIVWEALHECRPPSHRSRAALELAFDVMEAAFNHVWHEQHVTWTVDERLEVLLRGLGTELPETSRRRAVQLIEDNL